MCDYSLDFVASRPAKVGDKLVTTKFKNSLTGGFAAVEEPTVAVCVLPGTEIAFEQEVECEHVFNVVRSQKLIGAKLARFRQINLEQAFVHHDALEFPNGHVVKLAWLCEGQHATVLQLPASPRATKEAEQQRRCTLVNLIGPLAIAHCTTVVAIEEPSECRWLFDCPGAATKSHCRKRYAGPMNH